MKILKKVGLVSAACLLSSVAWGHGSCDADRQHCAYWHDSQGIYVKDGSGSCVRTGSWFEGSQVEGCDMMAPVDSDGDGVTDDMDNCPDTMAGTTVDMKGCPLDSDGDGVIDDKDNCPGTMAGVKVDMSGCPLDSDGDGVVDADDQCPNTMAGKTVDASGCEPPAPAAAPVSVELKVNFANNSGEVTGAYSTQMEALAYVLKANPAMSVVINGHTDSAGAEAYNQQLSQQRADAVAQYLVDNYGVNKDQLSAVGHGESMPIADNGTAEGRAANRRVEAEISQ